MGRPWRGKREGEKRCWASGGLGQERREERGPTGKERREEMLGWADRLLGSPSFASSFLFLYSIYSNKLLNSNRFEFKFYKLNTRKIMLQHECINMLTL
jgi:hypothetical protein